MPKSTKYAKKQKVIHPRSRKAQKMGKTVIHREKVNDVHNQTVLKHSVLRDKLLWVKDHIAEDNKISYSRQDLCDIVESYLKRFDEELEQIGIIKGIASRKNNQHASRAAAINLTISKEQSEYESGGLELPDLCNGRNLKLFLAWEGELRYLQRIKLRRVKKVSQTSVEARGTGEVVPLEEDGMEDGQNEMTNDVDQAEEDKEERLKDSVEDIDNDNTVVEVFDENHGEESEET